MVTTPDAEAPNPPRTRLLSAEAQSIVAALGIVSPDSAVVAEAEELAFEVSSPELYGHAVRSYLYAALLAAAAGIDHDDEVLAVGCLLHDVGLTPACEDPDRAFEHVSADRAAVLSEEHGWALRRRYTMHRAMVLHMAPSMPPGEEAEVVLLEAGVGCDVTGSRKNELTTLAHHSMFEAFPRPRFGAQFVAAMREQGRRHPSCHAAILLENGLAGSTTRHQQWAEEVVSSPVAGLAQPS